jgi:hypothetical protein
MTLHDEKRHSDSTSSAAGRSTTALLEARPLERSPRDLAVAASRPTWSPAATAAEEFFWRSATWGG